MNLYRIKSIAHSGRKGVRGLPRTDGRYPVRIGRIVSDIPLDAETSIGKPLVLSYVKDENGNDYSRYYLHCSLIIGIHNVLDELICIETLNTIYEFERVESEVE